MKMKTIRNSILCISALFLTASLLQGQGLSKYRGFSLGTSLATVLKHTDQKLADVNVTHGGPPLFQEVTWWPPNIPGTSYLSDSVEQILFSFYNGELYKISVTYDHSSTEGLTAADMVKSISAKYGPATSVESEIDPVMNALYNMKQNSAAMWEDSQYSFNLVRSSFTNRFELVIYSKRVNEEAERTIAEAVKLEKQDGPKREDERKKKEADDLEAARQKNQKTFRP
jgi:ribonuclease HI